MALAVVLAAAVEFPAAVELPAAAPAPAPPFLPPFPPLPLPFPLDAAEPVWHDAAWPAARGRSMVWPRMEIDCPSALIEMDSPVVPTGMVSGAAQLEMTRANTASIKDS